jgi:hypothetical protein
MDLHITELYGVSLSEFVDLDASPARQVLAASPRGDHRASGGHSTQGREVGVIIVEVGEEHDLGDAAVDQFG